MPTDARPHWRLRRGWGAEMPKPTTVYDCLQCKATMASTTGKPKKCIRCGSGEAYLKERGTI